LTYLNVKVGSDATGAGGGINLTGTCNYEVQELWKMGLCFPSKSI